MSWYLMHREWMNHPFFKSEPFTEREVWLWLIENAAYEEAIVRIRGLPVTVKRGSLSYSLRFLAEAWGWGDIERVRRYLKRLEKWGMIELGSVAQQTLVTICNYDRYQSPTTRNEMETCRKTPRQSDGDVTHNATNKKEVKEKNETKELNIGFGELPDWVPKVEFAAYVEFRQSIKKPIKTAHGLRLAVDTLDRLRREGHYPAEVLNQSVLNGWRGLFPVRVQEAALINDLKRGNVEKKSYSQKLMEATAMGIADARREGST